MQCGLHRSRRTMRQITQMSPQDLDRDPRRFSPVQIFACSLFFTPTTGILMLWFDCAIHKQFRELSRHLAFGSTLLISYFAVYAHFFSELPAILYHIIFALAAMGLGILAERSHCNVNCRETTRRPFWHVVFACATSSLIAIFVIFVILE